MLTKYRDFKYIFLGRLISNCGDSIYMLVLSWYVFESTHSPVYVGILNFILFLPNFFSFLFGAYIDNSNKKKLLIALEIFQFLAVVLIMIGISLDSTMKNFSLIIVFIGAFFAATAGSNTYTVQDAMIPTLVNKKDLPRSEMYMSVSYSGVDYIFTSISGFLLSFMSYLTLLAVDLTTFFISIISFLQIKKPHEYNNHPKSSEKKALAVEKKDLFQGFKTIYNNKLILTLCIGASTTNFMFGGLNVYILIIAKKIGGVAYYGLLTGFYSAGILVGSTVLSTYMLKKMKIGTTLWVVYITFGLLLSPILIINNKYLLLIIWFVSFMFQGVSQVIEKPIIQTEISNNKMGVVLSTYATITVSTLSIGSLFWGYIAQYMDWHIFITLFIITFLTLGIIYKKNHRINNYSL